MSSMDKFNVNGKEYDKIEDIPEDFKVMFRDSNSNGIPDFVEGILAGNNDLQNPAVHTTGNSKVNANFTAFFYNGKQYKDIDQLPPEAKQMVENGLNALGKTGMKIATGFSSNTNYPVNTQLPNNAGEVNMGPKTEDVMHELNPGFKFRVIMTIILFILAVVYIIWLSKLI